MHEAKVMLSLKALDRIEAPPERESSFSVTAEIALD
jgi:hypothetical protein